MNKIFQPCEAHIPYILQFMIDFNLQGMNYIHLKSALARRAPGNHSLSYNYICSFDQACKIKLMPPNYLQLVLTTFPLALQNLQALAKWNLTARQMIF